MTPLVVEEVVLHAGEFSALQRKAVDRRNPFPCAPARLREDRRAPASARKVGIPSNPGTSPKQRRLIEDGPALTLEGLRPSVRLAVFVILVAAGDFRGACRQPLEADPRRRERGRTGGERGLQNLPELRERGGRGSVHGVHENLEGVADPLQPSLPEDVAIRKLEQALPQRQQVAREVSAVHRRDVEGQQRLQGLRVVPVVEVTSMPRQGIHRAQRILRALDELPRRKVSEVVGGQVREERKPHVGRRRAMGDRGDAVFLVVVRRQPMVFRADEGLEERPGPPRKLPEKEDLVRRKGRPAASERAADPPGDGGGGEPQGQDGPGRRQRGRPRKREVDRRGGGDRGGDPHRSEKIRRALAAIAVRGPRRSPLEKPLAREQHPPGRAHDRVEAEKRLVRQARERERRLGEAPSGGARFGGKVLAQQRIGGLPEHLQGGGHQGGDQEDPDHRQGPIPGGREGAPTQQQQERQRGRFEAAPKIVEDLPLGQPRERVPAAGVAGPGNARQQPPGDLPIPADPSVATVHVRDVAGRIFLVQVHVAQQSRPRMAPFQEIVAEDPVLGEPSLEGLLERIDVVDPLADEGAFVEHVLVHIGDGARVRVDSRFAPEQARISRPVRARQAVGHARLQDAVPLEDALQPLVVPRAVQRVRHGSDELPRRVARQLRIRVEGDHEFDVRQIRRPADDDGKAIRRPAAKKQVQLRKLPPLAFVAHPGPLPRIPSARAVEKEERGARRVPVLVVQLLDPLPGQPQQLPVLRDRFLVRIQEIRQQAEVQVVIPIRQEPDFQGLDQGLDVAGAREHRRDHHQGARFRRDPFGEVHSRQRMRLHQQRGEPVHQRDRQPAGAQQGEGAEQGERTNPCNPPACAFASKAPEKTTVNSVIEPR